MKCFNSLAERAKDETRVARDLIPDGLLFARVAGRWRFRAPYCQPPTLSSHPELGADQLPLEGQLGNEEGPGCLQQL